MNNNQKLELTWIGKDEEVKAEPRILLYDKENSYGNQNTDNMLIHGDNLLALKALEQDFSGKIKCIYIDPPFNTGGRINANGTEIGYEDGLEHSIWLNMMYKRFRLLYSLLNENGIIIVHLDDRESAYCKVILDEIFGRNNYINTITMTTNDPSGFKATGSKIFSTSNFMLIYGKNKSNATINKIYLPKDYDTAYSKIFTNKNGNYKNWEWMNLKEYICNDKGYKTIKEAEKENGKETINLWVKEYALLNPQIVFRTAAIGGGAKIKRQKTIDLSKQIKNEIFVHENEDVEDFYILNGEQILFYDKRFKSIDNALVPAENLTDVWTDISWTGIANEGSVVFKNSKKPELLIKRVFEIFSNKGDLVLDSFLGSGTTAAVAHKMGRKWIGVELGDHCYTHCKPRLEKVVDGEQGGISKSVDWQGGGGFKFYELAQSLLKKDRFGNWIIDETVYNADLLAAAVAKLNGYKFCPSESYFWKQGTCSENAYIFTTTEYVSAEYLDTLSKEMDFADKLLVCCPAFDLGLDNRYDNIEIKKIPKSVLDKCEYGKDNYNLNIIDTTEFEYDDEECEE